MGRVRRGARSLRALGGVAGAVGALLSASSALAQQVAEPAVKAPPPAARATPPHATQDIVPVPSPLSAPVGLDLTLWWEAPLQLTPPTLLRDARQLPWGVPMTTLRPLWQPTESLTLDGYYEDAPGQPIHCFAAYCREGAHTMALDLFWRAAEVPVHAAGTTLTLGLAASAGAQTGAIGTTPFAFIGPRINFVPTRRSAAPATAKQSIPPETAVATGVAGALVLGHALSGLW